MSIVAVEIVCFGSAAIAAIVSTRGIVRGTTTPRDLWFVSIGALMVAFLLSFYGFAWYAALGGEIRDFLFPDLLTSRPKRGIFVVYILGSTGLSTSVVALLAHLKDRLGKA